MDIADFDLDLNACLSRQSISSILSISLLKLILILTKSELLLRLRLLKEKVASLKPMNKYDLGHGLVFVGVEVATLNLED